MKSQNADEVLSSVAGASRGLNGADRKPASGMVSTHRQRSMLAAKRENRKLTALGYRRHETDWEIVRGGRQREVILDVKISHDRRHVWTLIGDELTPKAGEWRWRDKTPERIWPAGLAPLHAKPGDDLELMFHGGSKARGNLYGNEHWGLVTAYRMHVPEGVATKSDDTREASEAQRPNTKEITNDL